MGGGVGGGGGGSLRENLWSIGFHLGPFLTRNKW